MIRDIVEQHAMEAGLLWAQRDTAVGDPHYDLEDLARLDDRVEAHLDALRIAGEGAWDVVKAAVEAGLDDDQAGDVFAAAAVATDHRDLQGIAKILDLAGPSPVLRRGMVSALGWLPFDVTAAILPGLLDPMCPPALTFLGIAACAVHRNDPGSALTDALYSDDAALRGRALTAAGELGRADLASRARAHLDAGDEEERFAAAFALALLGEGEPATEVLWALAMAGGRNAERAVVLALRRGDPAATRGRVELMARDPAFSRRAVVGAGALGDPALVPSLLQQMEVPELARVAGESFTLITGANLGARPLRGAAPEGFQAGPTDDPADEDVAMDPDQNLPWPNVAAVQRWWAEHRGRFPARTRHLLGRPIHADALPDVLHRGTQRQRAAAALELSFLHPGRPLFEVRAPGFRQRQALSLGETPHALNARPPQALGGRGAR